MGCTATPLEGVQWNDSTLKLGYNAATGKLQYVTGQHCECSFSGDDCAAYWAANETPTCMQVFFTGVKQCSDNNLYSCLEGVLGCVAQVSAAKPCDYLAELDSHFYWGCGGSLVVDINDVLSTIRGTLAIGLDPVKHFFFNNAYAGPGQYNNQIGIGDCGGDYIGYDGTIDIVDICA